GRDEVVVLEEVTTKLGGKEHDRRKHHQEYRHTQDVMHCVVWMERNAVKRDAIFVLGCLDLHAIGIVRTHVVQSQQVRNHQAQQHQRHRDHVETEETIQGGVTNHKIAADQQGEIRADKRDGGKEVHDHLCTPVAHLTPWQQV